MLHTGGRSRVVDISGKNRENREDETEVFDFKTEYRRLGFKSFLLWLFLKLEVVV